MYAAFYNEYCEVYSIFPLQMTIDICTLAFKDLRIEELWYKYRL